MLKLKIYLCNYVCSKEVVEYVKTCFVAMNEYFVQQRSMFCNVDGEPWMWKLSANIIDFLFKVIVGGRTLFILIYPKFT